MKKLILSGILVLLVAGTSLSRAPSVAKPIPQELFSPVILLPPKIVDNFPSATKAPRTKPKVNKPNPVVVPKETPKPQPPQQVFTGNTISGIASWYCHTGVSRCTIGHPGGYYAAIRRDLLELRGKRVLVCAGKGNCVRVTIIDCNCGENANLIDLYWDAFNAISDPSLGRIKVTLKW